MRRLTMSWIVGLLLASSALHGQVISKQALCKVTGCAFIGNVTIGTSGTANSGFAGLEANRAVGATYLLGNYPETAPWSFYSAGAATVLGYNVYRDLGGNKYIKTGFGAGVYIDTTGDIVAMTAPSGTAGAAPALVNGFRLLNNTTTFQLGGADSATPTASTLGINNARGGTDTNTAGAAMTIAGSKATGNAAGSQILVKLGTPQATGTTAHVLNTVETMQDFGLSNVQRAVLTTGPNVYQESIGNTKFVTADFTTASASFVTITGLSWTMPALHAMNAPFRCEFLYSQATAAVANQFGIQDVTVAPTSLMAKSTVWTSATAATNANVPALTTTTATSIVTFTPSAITTVWNATISGFIEQPSNAAESVINMLVLTGNASDSITVKRGSHCTVGF